MNLGDYLIILFITACIGLIIIGAFRKGENVFYEYEYVIEELEPEEMKKKLTRKQRCLTDWIESRFDLSTIRITYLPDDIVCISGQDGERLFICLNPYFEIMED